MVTFIVRISGDGVIDELSKLGRIVFRSDLIDWIGLEAEEANRPKIANMPGVLHVEQERIGTFC